MLAAIFKVQHSGTYKKYYYQITTFEDDTSIKDVNKVQVV